MARHTRICFHGLSTHLRTIVLHLHSWNRYYAANAAYIMLLAAGAAAGSIFSVAPLANTSITFALIWAGDSM